MLKVGFKANNKTIKILCLGAHCDDIEIGCGGTLLKLIDQYSSAEFHWVVFTSTPERKVEALASAEQFLKNVSEKTIVIQDFRDGFLPYNGSRVKEYFETLKMQFSPGLIFTHYRNDLHQDHRLICELTWNTFRNHLILEYEIPKYDGDFGRPNFFVNLAKSHCQKKVDIVLKNYTSQNGKTWFTEDTFLALMRIRGVESRSHTGYAEAFYCCKICLD